MSENERDRATRDASRLSERGIAPTVYVPPPPPPPPVPDSGIGKATPPSGS